VALGAEGVDDCEITLHFTEQLGDVGARNARECLELEHGDLLPISLFVGLHRAPRD
jgi:hypothetical protein